MNAIQDQFISLLLWHRKRKFDKSGGDNTSKVQFALLVWEAETLSLSQYSEYTN